MELRQAQQLLAQGKFKDAAKMIDAMLSKDNGNGELWYLRGVASMKMKNYDMAQEYFEKAIYSGKKAKYYHMKGMAHFEIFELRQAIEAFGNAVKLEPSDVTSHCFIAMCYIMLDDPRSAEHIKKAKGINEKKTRQLLLNFYKLFIEGNPDLGDAEKSRITERIRSL